jgi:hypothetical protein
MLILESSKCRANNLLLHKILYILAALADAQRTKLSPVPLIECSNPVGISFAVLAQRPPDGLVDEELALT